MHICFKIIKFLLHSIRLLMMDTVVSENVEQRRV
jgi:hypothetical protein